MSILQAVWRVDLDRYKRFAYSQFLNHFDQNRIKLISTKIVAYKIDVEMYSLKYSTILLSLTLALTVTLDGVSGGTIVGAGNGFFPIEETDSQVKHKLNVSLRLDPSRFIAQDSD